MAVSNLYRWKMKAPRNDHVRPASANINQIHTKLYTPPQKAAITHQTVWHVWRYPQINWRTAPRSEHFCSPSRSRASLLVPYLIHGEKITRLINQWTTSIHTTSTCSESYRTVLTCPRLVWFHPCKAVSTKEVACLAWSLSQCVYTIIPQVQRLYKSVHRYESVWVLQVPKSVDNLVVGLYSDSDACLTVWIQDPIGHELL